jgi:hypothetical protein
MQMKSFAACVLTLALAAGLMDDLGTGSMRSKQRNASASGQNWMIGNEIRTIDHEKSTLLALNLSL